MVEQESKEKAEKPLKKENLRVLRTFAEDSREFLSKQRVSLIEIAARAQRRGPFRVHKKKPFPRIAVIGIAAVIVLTVVGLVLWVFVLRRPFLSENVIEITERPFVSSQALLSVDGDIAVSLPSLTDADEVFELFINAKRSRLDGVFSITPIQDNETVPLSQLITLMSLSPPKDLKDHFTGRYTLLSVDLSSVPDSLLGLILESDSFEHAFSGMLSWEEGLPRQMRGLGEVGVFDSSIKLRFTDVVIANNDARVLYDDAGVSRAGYVIFNRKLIIISPHQQVLRSALDRLIAAP